MRVPCCILTPTQLAHHGQSCRGPRSQQLGCWPAGTVWAGAGSVEQNWHAKWCCGAARRSLRPACIPQLAWLPFHLKSPFRLLMKP